MPSLLYEIQGAVAAETCRDGASDRWFQRLQPPLSFGNRLTDEPTWRCHQNPAKMSSAPEMKEICPAFIFDGQTDAHFQQAIGRMDTDLGHLPSRLCEDAFGGRNHDSTAAERIINGMPMLMLDSPLVWFISNSGKAQNVDDKEMQQDGEKDR
jgi:hypothetical protein